MSLTKASQFKHEGAFITLYGQGGAGKTTLAAGAADDPDNGPFLQIDAEAGADAISHRSDVEVVEIKTYDQFDKVVQALKKSGHGFKSVNVDNVSEIIDLFLTKVTGSHTDAPEIQEWGRMTREIIWKVRELRAISREQHMNVFMCAWDADEKDDRGVLKKDLAFTPALRKEFPGVVTIIGHVSVTNDPNMRKLTFAPGPRTVAKFRRSADSAAQKIPFDIYYGVKDLPMADILRVMRGEGDWPANKYKEPKAGTGTS